MKVNDPSYLSAIEQARNSLKAGDNATARHWAFVATTLDPEKEDPWLILAAVASPRASLEYLNRALEINPGSQRAKKGIEWALARIAQAKNEAFENRAEIPLATAHSKQGFTTHQVSYPWLMLPALLMIGLMLLISYPAIFSILGEAKPIAFAQNFDEPANDTPTPLLLSKYYPDVGSKPVTDLYTSTPVDPSPGELHQPTPTPVIDQASLITYLPVITTWPTEAFTGPTEIAEPLQVTPFVGESATAEEPEPTAGPDAGFVPPKVSPGQRWVDVDLSQQMAFAFEGDQIVKSFVVSTGRRPTPTVTGKYKIYVKYRYANMSGPGYFLRDVPYVMYFYKGYGLHGTYWHHNFGTPMSHGCVNFKTKDAKWIYEWASVGTVVNVHK